MTEPVTPTAPLPPTPRESSLDAERRAILGDSRSVDQLEGPALQRWIAICGEIRALKRARGAVEDRPSKASRKRQIALADL